MTWGRLVAAVAVVVAVLMPSAAVAAAPAAMSVSVAPSPVARGAPVTVSGRTSHGARVEIYLGALVAATTASGSGAFRTTFRATRSGVVRIVGRGSVTRTRALSVFVPETSPASTVYVHEGQVASPCMSGRGVVPGHAEDCRFASPVVEIPAGATLHFAWTVTDRKSTMAGMVVGYGADRAERGNPADAVRWWQSREFADPDLTAGPPFPDLDLRPGTTSGRFLFEAGRYLTWSVTITETHPIRRFV